MKKILVALVMLALVFGSAAALEAALTVDIDTEIVSTTTTGDGDPVWGSIDQVDAATGWNYDDSAVDFTFKDDDGKFGGQITFDVENKLAPTLSTTFGNLNAWIMLGDYAKFTAGRITSGTTKRRNAIIDEQHLGPMTGTQGVGHPYRTDQLINTNTTASAGYVRNLELMTDFYLGKFFDQDYTITGAVFATSDNHADFGMRFSGTFVPDLLKINLTYRRVKEQTDLSKTLSSDEFQYRNNIGLYAEISPFEALNITAGYGTSIVLFTPKDNGTVEIDDPMGSGTFDLPVKDYAKSTDMYHGIDVRADFAVTDTILIEGQVNVSFGEKVFRGTGDETTIPIDKELEMGSTYFGIFGGLGAAIGFTDTLSFGLGATIWADTTTAVAKYDGSAQDDSDDGVKTEILLFGVEGTLTYAVSNNASAHIGLKFVTQQEKYDGKKIDAKDYSRFSIPVGITVKF